MLAGLLSRIGHEISTADCKQQALAILESKHFDVILSDINLPDGTGYELISQAKRTHTLKGIAISGLDASEDLLRSKEAGFDFHLIKPLDFPDLCGVLNGFDLQPVRSHQGQLEESTMGS
jgi:CheY-like chemotaxis protein